MHGILLPIDVFLLNGTLYRLSGSFDVSFLFSVFGCFLSTHSTLDFLLPHSHMPLPLSIIHTLVTLVIPSLSDGLSLSG